MAQAYDSSVALKRALTDRLRNEFDYTKITGLTENPIITRTITSKTPEPYIFIREEGSDEVWKDKRSEARIHSIIVEVVVKYRPDRGTHLQREEIAAEVITILDSADSEFPDLTNDGFMISVIETSESVKRDTLERGAKYYRALIPFEIVVQFVDFPQNINPVQASIYTYAGWDHNPTPALGMELYDSGTITGALTYPSGNNGWNFTGTTYALTTNSDGTLADNVLTVDVADGDVGLINTIDYEFGTDDTTTTSINNTDTWERIVSQRWGTVASENDNPPVFTDDDAAVYGLRDLQQWENNGNRNLDFGNESGLNEDIVINGVEGEYLYFVFQTTLNVTTISQVSELGTFPITDNFEAKATAGSYSYFIAKEPLIYDGNKTFKLS